MNTENNYDIDVMNGDIGKVLQYSYKNNEELVRVEFGKKEILFSSFPQTNIEGKEIEGDVQNLKLSVLYHCK